MKLNEQQVEISNALTFLHLLGNIERIFEYLAESKSYEEFTAKVEELEDFKRLYSLNIEKSDQPEQISVFVKFHGVKILQSSMTIAFEYHCVFSKNDGYKAVKNGYLIQHGKKFYKLNEAIKYLEKLFKEQFDKQIKFK